MLSFKKIDSLVVVAREVIKWSGLVLLGRYGYLSIVALAGHQTLADIVVRLLANVKLSNGILYLVTGGSVAYGLGQRHLRRKHIKRVVAAKNELEKKLDPNRTSSNLTETGTTRPGDEL